MAHTRAAGGIGGLILILTGVAGVVGTNVLFSDALRVHAENASAGQEEDAATDALRDKLERFTLTPSHAIHASYAGWDVTLTYPTRGHNDDVHAADKFNNPRLVGDHWEWTLARLEVTNTGDHSIKMEDLDIRLDVDGYSSAHENMGNLIVHQKLPNEFDLNAKIAPGETLAGSIGWVFSHEELDNEEEPSYLVRIEVGDHIYLGDVALSEKIKATR